MAGQQKLNGAYAFPASSTKSAGSSADVVPENLYHTTLTVIDYHAMTCGAINCLHVLATHTTSHAAKAFAYHDALRSLNYQPSDFEIYATRESIDMPQAATASSSSTTTTTTTTTAAPKPTTAAGRAKVAESSGAYESGYTTDTCASDTDTGGGGGPPIWPYGDEVLAYAKAPAGQEFLIGVVETPNTEHLASGGPVYGNTPLLPHHHHKSKSKSHIKSASSSPMSPMSPKSESVPLGYARSIEKDEDQEESNSEDEEEEELSYVIQTKTDYNQALGGGGQPQPTTARPRRRSSITRLFQVCEIEGCFPHKSEAIDFARHWLSSKKNSGMFVQYDERDMTPRSVAAQKEEEEDENDGHQWPFGEDVLVHAVAATGENYCVAVRTAEGARERFGKKKIVAREGSGGRKGSEEGWVRSYYEDSPKIET
ncbi:hypothetical protein SMACR_03593 [Sordaria macrospora]|uniref:WGS project CABT00000000 data, contig 2.9 n=2 Tax=Sordaria macrospora TaxID=5147 RepID=F7VVM1_SORMK|nr:uncharacterized protein SMAC_03593 [Sordaria macrospora k-hell]KAA8636119.1 hypothetical protein SMACR_03593 [Sordaria macrospora]WPJ65989.1 hypothetical protein SMAC4_03593 [Sordaria macrospora]CCC09562.1 unnamed protein product [Sordaria macrospora k-hell]